VLLRSPPPQLCHRRPNIELAGYYCAFPRRACASAITDRSHFYACATNWRSVRPSQAIFSSRPNRVALSAWAITPTCLLSSSTMGFVAPDLVGRRSRPCCKSPPRRHVSGKAYNLPDRYGLSIATLRYTWIARSGSVIRPTRTRPLRLSPIGTEHISPFRFHSSPPWRQLVQRNTAGWFCRHDLFTFDRSRLLF
jgi:hypothetical protein